MSFKIFPYCQELCNSQQIKEHGTSCNSISSLFITLLCPVLPQPHHKPAKNKPKLPTRVQPEVMPPLGESGTYTNKIHYLRKYLLDELVTKKFAMDFMEPVDTAVLQVPNYYNIIKRPMDVGTIIKRVQNRYYHRVDSLISDFRLVISNCFTFNRPGDVVYRNCQKLEKFFHRILNKMPKGEEKPSTKDPHASGKQQSVEKSNEVVQRLCREMTRKLHAAISREEDKGICKYFNLKLDLLSQKIDRHYFKTIEEFHFEVNSIFKTFDTQVKLFYEVYHKSCDHDPNIKCEKCRMLEDAEEADEQDDSSITLDKEDITDLMIALKKAENCVDLCMKSYSKEKVNRARDLINNFMAAADRLKMKLKLKRNDQETEQAEAKGAKQKAERDNEEETEEEAEGEDSEQEIEEEQGDGQVEEQEEQQDEYEEEKQAEENARAAQEQGEVAEQQAVKQYLAQCYNNSLMDKGQHATNANHDREYCKQPQANEDDGMAQDPPAYYMDPQYYNAKQFNNSADQQNLESDVAVVPEADPANPHVSTLWSDLQMSSSSDDSDKD